MANPAMHIKSLEFYKDVTIVRLVGEITCNNLKSTQDEFALKTKGKKVRNILFDIKDVTGADTTSIAALVDLLRYMKSHHTGEKIGIVNISSRVKNLFMVSKTQSLFSEYDSEEEAIKALR